MHTIIVGLGNPGKEYEKTRHNIGFMTLDVFVKSPFQTNKKFESESAEVTIRGKKILLLKPQTFMNNSGRAVQTALNFYKISPETNLWLIYDDIDVPFSTLKLRLDGGDGGHKGIRSIIQSIGTNSFSRIRMGIRNEHKQNIDTVDFVLSKFSKEEQLALPNFTNEACKVLDHALEYDFVTAMNLFNRKRPSES
ncbi:MAG: aminoacyl-tRNA hydrolase [bacterium]